MHWYDYGFYGDKILVHWYTQYQTIQSNETLLQISESREWMNVSIFSASFCYSLRPILTKFPLTMHDFAYGSKISHHSFMKLVRWTQTRVSLFFLLVAIISDSVVTSNVSQALKNSFYRSLMIRLYLTAILFYLWN